MPDLHPLSPEEKANTLASTDEDKSLETGPSSPEVDKPLDLSNSGTTPFDDDKTSQVIDDLVVEEADDVLKLQDAAADKSTDKLPKRRRWWKNKWLRRIVLLLVFGGLITAMALPISRYWLLNVLGVRVNASVRVVDSATQLPLKGVQVVLDGHKAKTDSQGRATLTGLKEGRQSLTINQVGFAGVAQTVVLGWGSNPLDDIALKGVGVQYTIEVKDYLSALPLTGVEASSGDATAMADKNGKIVLTLPGLAAAGDTVSLSKAGYRTEQFSLNADPKATNQKTMVLSRKVVFVSNNGGNKDLVKSDVDGQNRQVLLAGTGHEGSNLSLATSPDGQRTAFVSSRDNKRDGSGNLLSSLVLVNVADGTSTTIAEAPQIQLIDWLGTRLVFQQLSADASKPDHYKLISYDYADNTRDQLVAANNLTTVLSAQGSIYYVLGPDSSDDSLKPGLFKIDPKGENKQLVLDKEVWSALRPAYNTLNLQIADGSWYRYTIASNQTTPIDSPDSLANYEFVDNSDRTKSLRVNQGALISYDTASGKDTTITTQSGLAYPIEWLSPSAVIYRVGSSSETAEYALSLAGGTAHKVVDVVSAYGFTHN